MGGVKKRIFDEPVDDDDKVNHENESQDIDATIPPQDIGTIMRAWELR